MPWSVSYEEYFGLVMNGPRMFNRRVYQLGLAQSLAQSRAEIPLSVAASMAYTQSEAEELAFQINAARGVDAC